MSEVDELTGSKKTWISRFRTGRATLNAPSRWTTTLSRCRKSSAVRFECNDTADTVKRVFGNNRLWSGYFLECANVRQMSKERRRWQEKRLSLGGPARGINNNHLSLWTCTVAERRSVIRLSAHASPATAPVRSLRDRIRKTKTFRDLSPAIGHRGTSRRVFSPSTFSPTSHYQTSAVRSKNTPCP